MSSVKKPSYSPATAIEDAWWNVPAPISFARSIAFCVPATLSIALRSSSTSMS
jgi:hypothetical protein